MLMELCGIAGIWPVPSLKHQSEKHTCVYTQRKRLDRQKVRATMCVNMRDGESEVDRERHTCGERNVPGDIV